MTEGKAQDLAARLESDLGVGWEARGVLHYLSAGDTHTIAAKDVGCVLRGYVGREVLVVVLVAREWAPTSICPSCRRLHLPPACLACADDGR